MADTPSHFFKILLPQTLEDKKLSIPEKFVRKFGDELSDVVTLLVTNGCLWHVGLTKDGRRMWFDEGWHEFLMYHSVSVGYFLVFRYEGNSNFHVLIFDMTACEIVYPSNGEKVENEEHKYRVSVNSPMSHGKMYTPLSQQNHTKALDSTRGIKRHQACVDSSRRNKCKMGELTEGTAADPELLVSLQDKGIYVARNFGFVSEIERERAIDIARSFRSKNPSFMTIIRSRNISKRTLYVPANFTDKYLSRDSKYVIRLEDSDGKEWSVQAKGRQVGGSDLTKGWCEFSKEKKLGSGDIVLLELIRKEDILLKVSVFHSKTVLDTSN